MYVVCYRLQAALLRHDAEMNDLLIDRIVLFILNRQDCSRSNSPKKCTTFIRQCLLRPAGLLGPCPHLQPTAAPPFQESFWPSDLTIRSSPRSSCRRAPCIPMRKPWLVRDRTDSDAAIMRYLWRPVDVVGNIDGRVKIKYCLHASKSRVEYRIESMSQ
jgi:hypothetical protein